jgi:Smg protein
MNETVLDVLMYLFENFSDQDYEQSPDQVVLREELLQAGFGELEVDRALDWLEELASTEAEPFANNPAERSVRLFSIRELARLDTECRGYLVYLEQIGILSPVQRELVLDRLMALGTTDINVDQVKWVVLMVLFSQPGQENAFARMEDLVFEEDAGAVH